MERSDTLPEPENLASVPAPPPVKENERLGLEERLMQMCVSLRVELHMLYARFTALEEEHARCKKEIRGIRIPEIPATNNVSSAPSGEKSVLGGVEGDRAEALDLPTAEADSGKADAGVVSGDASGVIPVSPSEHGLVVDAVETKGCC